MVNDGVNDCGKRYGNPGPVTGYTIPPIVKSAIYDCSGVVESNLHGLKALSKEVQG